MCSPSSNCFRLETRANPLKCEGAGRVGNRGPAGNFQPSSTRRARPGRNRGFNKAIVRSIKSPDRAHAQVRLIEGGARMRSEGDGKDVIGSIRRAAPSAPSPPPQKAGASGPHGESMSGPYPLAERRGRAHNDRVSYIQGSERAGYMNHTLATL